MYLKCRVVHPNCRIFEIPLFVAMLVQEAPPSSTTTTTAGRKKRKKRRKKNNGIGSEKQSGAKQSSRIRSYDYKAWDNNCKFDVVG